ncbi:hypothetical protein GGR56DRAFT_225043 [Xylariaceae sp. FL0804]|nr:hypothetical protein GGR56DRAFT_225043 [Xylariaceae sp. FL0804]
MATVCRETGCLRRRVCYPGCPCVPLSLFLLRPLLCVYVRYVCVCATDGGGPATRSGLANSLPSDLGRRHSRARHSRPSPSICIACTRPTFALPTPSRRPLLPLAPWVSPPSPGDQRRANRQTGRQTGRRRHEGLVRESWGTGGWIDGTDTVDTLDRKGVKTVPRKKSEEEKKGEAQPPSPSGSHTPSREAACALSLRLLHAAAPATSLSPSSYSGR